MFQAKSIRVWLTIRSPLPLQSRGNWDINGGRTGRRRAVLSRCAAWAICRTGSGRISAVRPFTAATTWAMRSPTKDAWWVLANSYSRSPRIRRYESTTCPSHAGRYLIAPTSPWRTASISTPELVSRKRSWYAAGEMVTPRSSSHSAGFSMTQRSSRGVSLATATRSPP